MYLTNYGLDIGLLADKEKYYLTNRADNKTQNCSHLPGKDSIYAVG